MCARMLKEVYISISTGSSTLGRRIPRSLVPGSGIRCETDTNQDRSNSFSELNTFIVEETAQWTVLLQKTSATILRDYGSAVKIMLAYEPEQRSRLQILRPRICRGMDSMVHILLLLPRGGSFSAAGAPYIVGAYELAT
jgi:hypothetical protein